MFPSGTRFPACVFARPAPRALSAAAADADERRLAT
uniref:Uncharacterized protein n=1 Tax=Arundo donax TaxID=35708 RepID=A0A0A9CIV7_ARUDO